MPPSAAISVLTVYAIFYAMPVGCMEHKHRCVGTNAVLAIIEIPAQIKNKAKKALNALRPFEYSSDGGEQKYEQSPTSGVRIIPQECGSAGDLFRHYLKCSGAGPLSRARGGGRPRCARKSSAGCDRDGGARHCHRLKYSDRG